MKIHLLPLGARFGYEGEEFVKTGPMFATGKDGRQRMIPKYARLTVPGGTETAPASGISAGTGILAAFEAFYATCSRLVPDDKHSELDAARERFMKVIGA